VRVGTCCVNSTTVALCATIRHDGTNPATWLFYNCPDPDETCQWASGDNEDGCVGVRCRDTL